MDISLHTEKFEQDDQTWLGAAHGTDMARSITLDNSAFTKADHYPNGFLPSGLPLGKITDTGLYGPYSGSLTTPLTDGTQTLAGFLLSVVKVPSDNTVDFGGALFEHGRVVLANVPLIDVDDTNTDVPTITFA